MPIFYNVRKKNNYLAKGQKERYYLIAKSWDRVGYDDLIEHMVRHTSLTREEARSALSYLQQSIPELLKLGCTIDLGGLGYLMTTIQSEDSDTPDEANHHKVRDIRIRFVPDKKLREAVRRLPVECFPDRGNSVSTSKYNHAIKKVRQETEQAMLKQTIRNCIQAGLSQEIIAQITELPESRLPLLSD